MSQEEVILNNLANKKWRVKLYELSQGGQWSDNGTGYVYIEETPEASLIMQVTERNRDTHKFPINENVTFNLQNKTILTWQKDNGESKGDDDTAISFQEKEGISEIWRFICQYTGKRDYDDDLSAKSDNIIDALRDVSRTNLPFIAREIREDIDDDDERIKDLVLYIKSNNCDFIKKLGRIFNEEERELDSKDESIVSTATTILSHDSSIEINSNDTRYRKTMNDSRRIMKHLSFIYSIFKNIILLADEELIQSLLSDSFYMTTFGALEYDFESLQTSTSIKHRDYLQNEVHFNNYLNITDDDLLNRIHFNYRLKYLRNTALGGVIKERYHNLITTIIKKNNEYIVNHFITHKELISNLMSKLNKSKDNEVNNNTLIKEGLCFVIELMNCAKETAWYRHPLNKTLCEFNLIDKIVSILNNNTNGDTVTDTNTASDAVTDVIMTDTDTYTGTGTDTTINTNQLGLLGIKIIIDMISDSPLLIKDIIIEHKASILILICDSVLKNQNDLSIKHSVVNMIAILFDNCVVYDPIETKLKACLIHLVDILPNKCISWNSKVIILTILSQCLSLPSSITQLDAWITENEIEEKTMEIKEMTHKRDAILHLIQFLNALVINDFDMQLSEPTIDWIISVFNLNIKKGNAIASAILSLFDSIRKTKPSLIGYLFSLREQFFYDNCKYFKGFIEEYEKDCSNIDGGESLYDEPHSKEINRDMDGIVVDNEDNEVKIYSAVFDTIYCNKNIIDDDEDNMVFLGKKTHSSSLYDDIFNP